MIEKGPSYQEQNCINWKINEKVCKDAVAECKRKWSLKEGVDIQDFNEWENVVNHCIERRIKFLRGKHINRRKQHVLKSRKHLNYLRELQSKYVLVPVDKATNNVIVVLFLKRSLQPIHMILLIKGVKSVVAEHLANKNIIVVPELRHLPSSYWLPKLPKQPMVQDFWWIK